MFIYINFHISNLLKNAFYTLNYLIYSLRINLFYKYYKYKLLMIKYFILKY